MQSSSHHLTAAATKPQYDLNVNSYSLNELLGLFHLNKNNTITVEDLKRAKKMVLMLHPDKSGLSSEYFLFYKQALSRVVELFDNIQKQNQLLDETSVASKTVYNSYVDDELPTEINEKTRRQFNSDKFNEKFNDFFNKHVEEKPNESRNEWFRSDTSAFNIPDKVTSGNINDVMTQMKERATHQGTLTTYRGEFKEMYSNTSRRVGNLYDSNSSSTNGDGNDVEYASSDIFDNLSYEDIRKVHRDNTIISVNVDDTMKNRLSTEEEYKCTRTQIDNTPVMSKREAECYLAQKSKKEQDEIMTQQYKSMLKNDDNKKKRNMFISQFLQLENSK